MSTETAIASMHQWTTMASMQRAVMFRHGYSRHDFNKMCSRVSDQGILQRLTDSFRLVALHGTAILILQGCPFQLCRSCALCHGPTLRLLSFWFLQLYRYYHPWVLRCCGQLGCAATCLVTSLAVLGNASRRWLDQAIGQSCWFCTVASFVGYLADGCP
jgi:hypothetical protein